MIVYRTGCRDDSLRIAELDYIASDGAIEYLFHDLVPEVTPVQIVFDSLKQDHYPFSYRSTIVADQEQQVIGFAMSFPAEHHLITDDMREFLPVDRLAHFKTFFSTRVEGSFFLDALCVDEAYRNQGVGQQLLDLTKTKALKAGFNTLSLLAFADNLGALNFYKKSGFVIEKTVELKSHRLIPHEGGCLLMKCDLL
jgi:ribosomal protein S18 acetylase RimI-like enzyme